ncbi:MAG: glycosyltransferase family 2 protein [Paracoccus sp. (in: a-proteobacteria)]|uniref:glycosyltransferase family 2 protein n=1 Tax=Paracoccus sp. TaxID=267 RepID=UPI0026DEA67F|nr:glycosyltransferase family 2 protein [Paracoccus sp. (in: a-proteobacteria)]MDO5612654.1 glycosyltransferase family 2 protein [Paracoccus sp. (in: a-proteobacteria)]
MSGDRIAIIIVNYRTPHLVCDCLDSLADPAARLDLRVFIGDAESGDGSVQAIHAHITQRGYDWAECAPIGKNGGFAYGNNAIYQRQVAPDASFGYVHFLNPDTVIRPGAVDRLWEFLRDHPDAGIAGSQLLNPDGSLAASGFRFPVPWREFFRGLCFGPADRLVPSGVIPMLKLRETQQVDWVSGASFMARRSLLDEVGLMDDGFFLYFEETDLMTRARRAGQQVWFVADSLVVHYEGQSTGLRPGEPPPEAKPISPIWLQSRRRYLRRHHGAAGLWAGNALFLLGNTLHRVQARLRGKHQPQPPHLWRDYLARDGNSGKGG